jgi:hypothetical protein
MAEFIVVHSVKVATEFVPKTFGRLTTIGPKFRLPSGNKGKHKFYQVCCCRCGSLTVTAVADLQSEHTQSCGCLHKEASVVLGKARTVHGMTRSPEHISYQNMKDRCMNHNYPAYSNYGGRGIRVCDRWLEPNGQGFMNFFSDMGRKPHPQHTIERRLVNGNYCPENCCWATKTEQARNRRNNHLLTFNGKTQCVAEWAQELGYPSSHIYERLRHGWSVEKALTTPVKVRNAKKNP